MAQGSARLLSVNVGLPRDVAWEGRTVRTAVWKAPVAGRVRVGRLNLEGDGQGDLAGHGGEQRAVFVYQSDAYRYWERELGRADLVPGNFGENFTVDGLPDDETCIGDRYRIGSAVFEVTQPRVTCYRVGMRMREPRMPALLTGSGRPGFYFRVIEEGEVEAGDAIVKIAEGEERMTIAEVNALLYLPGHPHDRLERALRIHALSPGWRWSFEALVEQQRAGAHGPSAGNPGLAPASAAHRAAPGFARMRVARIVRETDRVLSFTLEPTEGRSLTVPLPGQFVVVRLPVPGGPPVFRSYSLSGQPSAERYRISVKVEAHGVAGAILSRHVHEGDGLDVSAPRGDFVLQTGTEPVVLVSAGIGATPTLAMLHSLAAAPEGAEREVWWLYGAPNREGHPFAVEAHELLRTLGRSRSHVVYSRPSAAEQPGKDFDAAGRLAIPTFKALGVPKDADFYLCGPQRFLDDLRAGLAAWGVRPDRIHSEVFAGGEPMTPGVVGAARRTPHVPDDAAPDTAEGPLVSFARSGLAVRAGSTRYRSLLELAEACDVPVRWSCRTGVCHNCESGILSGSVTYAPEPLERPPEGQVLICCSRPEGDVALDL
jgi:ferredoxin-NADP reductase/MOSC domain-containing protein YiiM